MAIRLLTAMLALGFATEFAAAQAPTKAASVEEALVITFKRMCIDIAPHPDDAPKVAQALKWTPPTRAPLAPLCGDTQAKFNFTAYQASDFGFPVVITFGTASIGNTKIHTCAVDQSGVNASAVLRLFKKVAGSGDGRVFEQPTSTQTTWGLRKGKLNYRISAFDFSKSGKSDVALTACEDSERGS
jgi:hypothetical protein